MPPRCKYAMRLVEKGYKFISSPLTRACRHSSKVSIDGVGQPDELKASAVFLYNAPYSPKQFVGDPLRALRPVSGWGSIPKYFLNI